MKLTVTKECVERAIAQSNKSDPAISVCCPVYQAAMDAGLEVIGVGYEKLNCVGVSFDIDENGQKITRLNREEWPSIKTTIEVEVTPI